MEDTYRFLRRVEHRLQTMFDRQTHEMPARPRGAAHPGDPHGLPARPAPGRTATGPAQRFLADYRAKTELNRKILNHLLHDAFRDDDGVPADPVVDLVLDPDPGPELDRRGPRPLPVPRPADGLSEPDGPGARGHPVPLAGPLPPLPGGDRARGCSRPSRRTPDPDMALTNLEKVSASLGAKAILWELFSFNPPTLRLYVELCATQPVPLRDPDQQPGHDRRPDGLPGRRSPAAGRGDQGRAGRALPGGRGPRADPAQLPEQGVGADRHPRHPRPRADPRRDPRAGRRRRGDRRPGRRATSGTRRTRRYGIPRRASDGRGRAGRSSASASSAAAS